MLAKKANNIFIVTILFILTALVFVGWKCIVVCNSTTVVCESEELQILLKKYTEEPLGIARYEAAGNLAQGLREKIKNGAIINFNEIKKYLGSPDVSNISGFHIGYYIGYNGNFAELSFYTDDYRQRIREVFVSLIEE